MIRYHTTQDFKCSSSDKQDAAAFLGMEIQEALDGLIYGVKRGLYF
jgi:hypothetical protein